MTIEADGESVCVSVFVQPESEQNCLLGMNVLPDLGLTVCRSNGESLIVRESAEVTITNVMLLQSNVVFSLKG